jgi:hypothetical protein
MSGHLYPYTMGNVQACMTPAHIQDARLATGTSSVSHTIPTATISNNFMNYSA